MAIENRFKQSIVVTLAKRAANRCSNPSCKAITSGPTDDPNDSVNVGEAAHIYGAHPGSARYDIQMTSIDRSSISNAIWLCSNCHKLIDDDPLKYPAGLLFEWQREHERQIAELIGKAEAEIKVRYEKRHLGEFGQLSYLAERIILEKNDYWEYELTAEVLRYKMAPIIQRWKSLKKELYIKSTTRIDKDSFISWMSDQLYELSLIVNAFTKLINSEFISVWGDYGIAGNDIDIVTTSRLYAEVCKNALEWEERIRFSRVEDTFLEIHELLEGIAGHIIEQAEQLPQFLSDMLMKSPTSGKFELQITIKLPEGWSEKIEAAMAKSIQNL